MKLSHKVKKRIQGSISVLMAIILVPTMVLSALIVDTARINMAKSMVSSAGDLALSSTIADYDTILKDVYGLFAMSQGKTDSELAADIKGYFEKTLVSYGVTNQADAGAYVDQLMGDFNQLVSGAKNGDIGNFMAMEIPADGVAVKGVESSALSNPKILKTQILEYMKYRAPAEFGLSFLDTISAFKNVQAQNTVVQAKVETEEKTQDVTSNCKNLMKEIREYDAMIEAMEGNPASSTTIVNGVSAYEGTDIVKVYDKVEHRDYPAQFPKYKEGWNPNYAEINRLALVFHGNPVDISSAYCLAQGFGVPDVTKAFVYTNTGDEELINDVQKENCGITGISISSSDTTDGKKTQLESQIGVLGQSQYTSIANQYVNANFLPADSLLSKSGLSYTDIKAGCETQAMEAFIAFEKFMTNTEDSSIKYSQVKAVLEEIYKTKLYYDAYITALNSDITEAKTDMDSKTATYNTKVGEYNTAVTNKNSKETDLETAKTTEATKKTEYESAVTARETLEEEQKKAPETVPKGSTKKKKSDYDEPIKKAKETEATAKAAWETAKNAIGGYETSYNNACAAVTTAETAKNKAENEKKEAETKYNGLVTTRKNMKSSYSAAISTYKGFTERYQTDLYYYGQFQNCARKAISDRVLKIKAQFTKIENNLKSILDKLSVIDKAITDTDKAIQGYIKTIEERWEKEADSYSNNDSFKAQQKAEIEAAKKTYNRDSLLLMRDYMTNPSKDKSVYNKYKKIYDKVAAAENYKYGSTRIDVISNDNDVIAAVASIKSSLPQIVTIADANSKLNSLYKDVDLGTYETMQQATFTNPVLPIQFLKYLNQNYPKEATTVTVATGNADSPTTQKDAASVKKGFEEQKKTLKDSSGKDIKDAQPKGITYSYKDKTIASTYEKSEETVDTKDFKLDEKDDKIDASSGLTKQNNKLNSILGGLSNIAETGIDNVLIMSYIFENFSYNTIVQDMVIDDKNINDRFSADNALNGDISAYIPKMLSSYPINAANNYGYGAEIEYLLYGNKNLGKNVQYAKASIYAIRFAFNCIFAFTDHEIKAITAAAGMAVQAATLGIVPCQIVQIVLQLAVAAAESASDLSLMNKGLKVAVVKSKDTWVCSVSGAVEQAKDFVIATADKAVDKAITAIADGTQKVIDATADELSGAISNLKDDVDDATKQKVEEISDAVFGVVEEKINGVLDELCFMDGIACNDESVAGDPKSAAKAAVTTAFSALETNVSTELNNRFASNELAKKVLEALKPQITGILSGVKQGIIGVIDSVPTAGISSLDVKSKISDTLLGKMNDIKITLISKMTDALSKSTAKLNTVIDNYIKSTVTKLNGKIAEASQDLKEEASKKIKEEVTSITDELLDSIDETGAGSKLGKGMEGKSTEGSSSVANLIRFGYKDYLMLFVYINLCANKKGEVVIGRMANLIEANIKNADNTKGASYKHKKGTEFSLKNAKTYAHLHAEVKVKMLFLNMDFFNKTFESEGVSVEEQLTKGSTIVYNNFYGY